jgi:GGDEF domain-containing protein
MMEDYQSTNPFACVEDAVRALLASLHDFVPMRLWMVGRIVAGRWTILGAEDRRGRIAAGAGFSSDEAFCRYITACRQPLFIEDASLAHAPPAPPGWSCLPMQACIGYPLISHRKEVLATLFGADEERQAPFSLRQRKLVGSSARTIGLLLAQSGALLESRRLNQQFKPSSEVDQITGLPNLQAWRQIIEQEETALMPDAENALVAIAEMQEPDALLSPATLNQHALRDAALLKSQLRETDTVARVAVNRYALLIRSVTAEQEQRLFEKIRQGFSDAGLAITLGCAMRLPSGSLAQAVRMADIRMYNEKLRRKP